MTPALDNVAPQGFFHGAVRRILELQRADGSIPWYDAGVWDPWNHGHAVMGLALMGYRAEADLGLRALADRQNPDGSWWAQYGSAVPLGSNKYEGDGDEKKIRDTNYCAYIAAVVLHDFLLTADRRRLADRWPMVRNAVNFVLKYQSVHGEIRWAAADPGTPQDDALVTGSSSIYKSLECAIRIARELGHDARDWLRARERLGDALRNKPHRFDRQWEKKDYFSMDWYYPVLTGVYRGDAARARIASRWNDFVADGKGCLCVLQQPWVTIAESCELVLALLSVGDPRARAVWDWQHQWRDAEGAYWMGWQFKNNVPWPEERPAWTSAAVILAADALANSSPAAQLFTSVALAETPEHA
jgi:hypothetical protein